MSKILSKIRFVYTYIISSIGFYPTVISLVFFILSILILYLETQGLSERINERLPIIIVQDGDAAQTILNSIVTGVISLTVFSFTMVMLILNQAGSNFSPRVIPGLISHKSNQKILGLYLGTLIYSLILMANIRSESYYEELPGLAVYLAMAFMIICLGAFVYFIHSISQSIQIDNILESIHAITKRTLQDHLKNDQHLQVPNAFFVGNWQEVNSPHSGYMQSVDNKALIKLCKQHDVLIEFTQPFGNYLVAGTPFLRISKELSDLDKFCESLMLHINMNQEELPEINYLYGFKQITESAVKAMSSGINDPGTAIKAIDYLTDLFSLRMELTDELLLADDDGVVRVRFVQETFDYLYTLCLTSIRRYSKADTLVVLRLLYLLKTLLYKVEQYPSRKHVLYKEALVLLHGIDKELTNPGDRKLINAQIEKINTMGILEKELPQLQLVH